ncbi:arginine repressor [Alkalitalea saponilacus]|uniref:Arginine repressor n=1 Tax=Alkalitalea saponilacus TaxID=889453 RepID=A0A1T5AMB1_9BACT|nr:arginine repressor [Alkalitalea saponilacus]ASB48657.1 arginine repressor [Alkalitalea saponilacus]SKB35980.1 transcriptional regulator, ArgR family [Alkalitalea saponilacus]
MKIKTQRINAIIRLIEKNRVGSQEELLALLGKEGFSTTQATLSRDLKALKVAKQPGNDGGYIYVLPDETVEVEKENLREDFPLGGILSLEFSGNMAVVKTRPGFANGIASVIDGQGCYEILGTIAGDDTILLICREGISIEEVLRSLDMFIPGIEDKVL